MKCVMNQNKNGMFIVYCTFFSRRTYSGKPMNAVNFGENNLGRKLFV